MKKILIPIDGSEFSDRALEKGKEIAKAMGSEVILLHVVFVDVPNYVDFAMTAAVGATLDSIREAAEKSAQTILENGKEKLGDIGSISLEVQAGNPADTIIRMAESEEVDLIVMGSEGIGSASKGILLGSVTNRVVHSTKVPVLVVK